MSNFLRIFGINVGSKKFKLPNEYNLEVDYDLTLRSIQKDWQIGESYGQVQLGNNNNYFQDKLKDIPTTITDFYGYHLWNTFDPKTFNISDFSESDQIAFKNKGYPDQWEIPFKSGKLVSKRKFQYGIFRIKARVPQVKYAWPAIWLTGTETWPPEIDIVEFYNHGKVQYSSSNNIIAQPNIHYVELVQHKATNPGSKYVKHPDLRDIVYTLHWEKDFIKIYYDDILVYSCTDRFILDQFDQPMSLILNNAVEWGVDLTESDINNLKSNKTFNIMEVKYYSK